MVLSLILAISSKLSTLTPLHPCYIKTIKTTNATKLWIVSYVTISVLLLAMSIISKASDHAMVGSRHWCGRQRIRGWGRWTPSRRRLGLLGIGCVQQEAGRLQGTSGCCGIESAQIGCHGRRRCGGRGCCWVGCRGRRTARRCCCGRRCG
jgi:hypothetical protein